MRQIFCNIALLISFIFVCGSALADDVDDLLKQGANSLVGKDIQQAINYFSLALQPGIATNLQLVSAYSGLCASRYKVSLVKKDRKLNLKAIQDCNQALFLKSDQQSVYRMRGIAYLTYGNFARAVSDLNVAVALKPSDFLSIQNRGLAKARLGQYDAAIVDFDSAIELKPTHPWGYYNRGRIHAILYRYEKAVDDFSTFIRFNRTFPLVYMHRGRSQMRLGHYQQAVGDFYEAIRLDEGDKSIAIAHRGIALYLLERFDEAAIDLEKVVKLNPKDIESRFWLYLARARLGQPLQNTFIENGGVITRNTWGGEMSAYLMGLGESYKVLDMARATKDDVIRGERESLSTFIFGEWAALQGRVEMAKKWFEIIINKSGPKPPWFYGARQQMERLKTQKQYVQTLSQQAELAKTVVAVLKKAQVKNDKIIAAQQYDDIAEQQDEVIAVQQDEVIAVQQDEVIAAQQDEVIAAQEDEVFEEKRDKVKLTMQRHLTNLPKREMYNSSTTDSDVRYMFKMASFKQLENANKALEEARMMGYTASIQNILINGNNYMRVWVGPFADFDQANRARDVINKLHGRSPGRVQRR
ncbi:MAG: tetratricopeptide repeat protein [Magnetococcales bacterium]|nr:tetratricopeptide repeat protein [Magnetococcales bacterium]